MARYNTPSWVNESAPAINQAALTALGEAAELGEHAYGICTTAAATAAKTVSIYFSGTLSLFTGLCVRVRFSNGNTAANPTLNVNGTGDISIRAFGSTRATTWQAGQQIAFTYNGAYWDMVGFDAFTKSQSLSDATVSAVASLTGSTPATPDDALGAIVAKMAGQANIVSGTYTGSGAYGSGSPASLTFSFAPRLVLIYEAAHGLFPHSSGGWDRSVLWADGQTETSVRIGANANGTEHFIQSGNTLSWWSTTAALQLNTSGTTYHYIALG